MRVLVTWASPHGGTAGIGRMIGEELTSRGFDVVASRAKDVSSPADFDAVIAGGGSEILAAPSDLLVPGDVPGFPYPVSAVDAGGRTVVVPHLSSVSLLEARSSLASRPPDLCSRHGPVDVRELLVDPRHRRRRFLDVLEVDDGRPGPGMGNGRAGLAASRTGEPW